ncbi:hypothetical protein EBU99_00890 [bacterium]|nr:hypothetical protein [bacterium]
METTQCKGRWFKLSEAAQALGVSEITVRRKAKAGQLKAILRNGRYMVYLEEDNELGLFTASVETQVVPTLSKGISRERSFAGFTAEPTRTNERPPGDTDLIQNLKRTIEDQQTLIASLEDSISRLSQRLSSEKHSSR